MIFRQAEERGHAADLRGVVDGDGRGAALVSS